MLTDEDTNIFFGLIHEKILLNLNRNIYLPSCTLLVYRTFSYSHVMVCCLYHLLTIY